ncbi:SDR family oxidoreductase [bacterium]|nr:SDR family oxidoreductase [bacterium]
MSDSKVILITGASRGIGAAAAKLLSSEGFRVYGTYRKPVEPPAPDVTMLELDVTDDNSVAACVKQVIDAAGRLDVLINNAGYAHRGPLENVTVADFRAQFETNLYGVHRLIQATLPHMWSQGGGRIVNVSSAIGRVAIPFSATYCSSKFALEGYSEGLQKELNPHGIDVVIVEPGLTITEFQDNSTRAKETDPRYQPAIDAMLASWPERRKLGDTAEVVAEVILRAVRDEKPDLRYVAPNAAKMLGGR